MSTLPIIQLTTVQQVVKEFARPDAGALLLDSFLGSQPEIVALFKRMYKGKDAQTLLTIIKPVALVYALLEAQLVADVKSEVAA